MYCCKNTPECAYLATCPDCDGCDDCCTCAVECPGCGQAWVECWCDDDDDWPSGEEGE